MDFMCNKTTPKKIILTLGIMALGMLMPTNANAASKKFTATKMKEAVSHLDEANHFYGNLFIDADKNGAMLHVEDYITTDGKEGQDLSVFYDKDGKIRKKENLKTSYGDGRKFEYNGNTISMEFDCIYETDAKGKIVNRKSLEDFNAYLEKHGVDCSLYVNCRILNVSKKGVVTFCVSGYNGNKLSSCVAKYNLKTGKIDKKNLVVLDYFVIDSSKTKVYGFSQDEKSNKYVLHRYDVKSGEKDSFAVENVKVAETLDIKTLDSFFVNNGKVAYANGTTIYVGDFKTKKMKKIADLSTDKYASANKWKIQDIAVVNEKEFYVLYKKIKGDGAKAPHVALRTVRYFR